MHAMQYTFTLPADCPMDVIRERVARTGRPVPEGPPLSEVAADAVRETGRPAALGGALLAAAVVDTGRWEMVHLSLPAGDAPDGVEGEAFRVPHLSGPGRGLLPRGRQW